jgi:hypothetical protein
VALLERGIALLQNLLDCESRHHCSFSLAPLSPAPAGSSNEEEFLWRAADTKTGLNGTAALTRMEF